MKNEQENNKEIKKFQPETAAESSTTAEERKEQENQIIKKFDTLLNLVPTDEQLTGDEKIKNYFLEREEKIKTEREEKERQIQRRKEEDEKEDEILNGVEKTIRAINPFNPPIEKWGIAKKKWNEWMGEERLKEREEWKNKETAKKLELLIGIPHKLFLSVNNSGNFELQQLSEIREIIEDDNQSGVRKFTSTVQYELAAIQRDFSDFVEGQNIVIKAREQDLAQAIEDNLQIKQQGEAKIKDYEEQGQKITEKLIETEKAEKKEREKFVEISKKLETEKNNFLQLEKEKDRLTSENQGLNEKLTNFKNKEQEWEARKQEIEQLINQWEQEKKGLAEKLSLRENEVKNYEDKAREISERLKKNRTLPDPAKINHEELKKEFKNLENQHQEQTFLIEAGKVEISNKNERINYLNNGIESLKNEILNWEQKLSAKRGEISELEKKINELKLVMENQEREINILKEKINRLEAEKKTLESEIERLRKKWEAEIEETAKEKIKLNNSLITKQGQYDRLELNKTNDENKLKKEINQQKLLLTESAKGVENWKKRHKEAEAEKQKFNNQFIEADEDNKGKQRTINDLQEKKTTLESENSQLQNELSKTKEDLTKEQRKKRLGNLLSFGVFASDYLPLPKKWNGAIRVGFESAQAWQIVSDLPNSTYEIIIGLTGIMAFFVVRSLWYRIFGRKEINKIAELQGELTEMRTKILVDKVSELTNPKTGEISLTKNEQEQEQAEPQPTKRKKKPAKEPEPEVETRSRKDGKAETDKEQEK